MTIRIMAECPDDGGRYLRNPDGATWTCEKPHGDGWHTIGTPDVLLEDGERVEPVVEPDGATVLYIARDKWPGDDDLRAALDGNPWDERPVGNPDGYCTEPCRGVGVLHPYHGVGTPPAPPARSYVVGLPVVITVNHRGEVAYEVDTSEAGVAVWQDEDKATEYEQEQVRADCALIEADHERRRELAGPHECAQCGGDIHRRDDVVGTEGAIWYHSRIEDFSHIARPKGIR